MSPAILGRAASGHALASKRQLEWSFSGKLLFSERWPCRLARGCERLSQTLAGLHYVAFSFLMLHKAAPLFVWSS